jgi:hypothetical protein
MSERLDLRTVKITTVDGSVVSVDEATINDAYAQLHPWTEKAKSLHGERVTVLCGWCKAETKLHIAELRLRIKASLGQIFCSPLCAARHASFNRDKKIYGGKSMVGSRHDQA